MNKKTVKETEYTVTLTEREMCAVSAVLIGLLKLFSNERDADLLASSLQKLFNAIDAIDANKN